MNGRSKSQLRKVPTSHHPYHHSPPPCYRRPPLPLPSLVSAMGGARGFLPPSHSSPFVSAAPTPFVSSISHHIPHHPHHPGLHTSTSSPSFTNHTSKTTNNSNNSKNSHSFGGLRGAPHPKENGTGELLHLYTPPRHHTTTSPHSHHKLASLPLHLCTPAKHYHTITLSPHTTTPLYSHNTLPHTTHYHTPTHLHT